ncbi:MAG: hypothetical protein ACE3JQ_02510 [Paenisporosarcina sp.]
MTHILLAAVNDRRTALINKLNKSGYDSLERLTGYTLSDLESANVTHLANLGKIMTRRMEDEANERD